MPALSQRADVTLLRHFFSFFFTDFFFFVENLLLLSLLKDANEAQSNLLDFFLTFFIRKKVKRIPVNSIKLPAKKKKKF